MAKTRFTTPVGRMVQGDVDTPNDKDMQGAPRVIKSGPNAGQPNPQYFVGVAVQKTDPAWPAFWEVLVRQAFADFPTLFPHGVDAIIAAGGPRAWFAQPPQGHQMPWVMGDFSWKVQDGDASVIREGKLINYSEREGFGECWIVKCQSSYPPRCFHAGRYATNEQIQEKGAIKRGYLIRVNGATEGNSNAQKPGLYVNLDMVELSGYLPEIVSGPDASAAFGGGPGALPAGATTVPTTPMAPVASPPPPPVVPAGAQRPTDPQFIHAAGTPQEQWFINGNWQPATAAIPLAIPNPAVPPSPSPVVAASSVPVSPPPPPYAGFMNPGAPGAAPPPPTVAAPPPAPIASPGRVMLPAAQGATYEQMIGAGWTDDTLRQNGMMA